MKASKIVKKRRKIEKKRQELFEKDAALLNQLEELRRKCKHPDTMGATSPDIDGWSITICRDCLKKW